MNELNKHIVAIKNVSNSLVFLAKTIQDAQLEKYLIENTNSYISIFKEAFDPNKEIKGRMKYFADVRTLAKYNENLINGWLVEDFYIYIFNLPIFKEHRFEIKINNHDSDRVIKKDRKYISSDPDFTIVYDNKIKFDLEIQALFLNLSYMDIKENKANMAINRKSFIYMLNLRKKETIYFFPYDILNYGKLRSNKNWGDKKSYKFIFSEIPKKKKIRGNNIVNDFLFTLYLFAYYKKNGEKKFKEFGKEVKLLNRTDIIQQIFNSFL